MSSLAEANSCLVVGAGVSGLLAARELQSAGWRVVVLEEECGVGGRMATLRLGRATVDHGAQFFTVRSGRFRKLVDEWLAAGVVREWSRGFANAEGEYSEDGYPRYRVCGGMASLPEHLARGLAVRTGRRAVEASARAGGWEVGTRTGAPETAEALLLTAPVPRSMEIVHPGNFTLSRESWQTLEAISYAPCLALTLLLDGPTGIPEPGGVQIQGEPLDWIGDNQRKGISEAPSITIHAGPGWSREHFDDSEAEITHSLISFAARRLRIDLASRTAETLLTRWRYSWVTRPHPEPCLLACENPPLLFAGDAFGSAKVEGAALSGLAAADLLLGRKG